MTAENLARLKCEVCRPGTPPIDESQAERLHAQIHSAWQREGNSLIRRTFEFRNFREPFGLATKIALLAEEQGHHPDLEIGWGRLVVTFTTHAAGGLTPNDFIMAAKIDRFTA